MFDDIKKNRRVAKWIIGIISICALIILGLFHIGSIARVASQLINLIKPILIGIIVALILNVPMRTIEQRLLPKLKIKKGKRSLSIILALLLIIGVLVGVSFLVIPELVNAISLIVQIIANSLEQLADLEKTGGDLTRIPFSEYLDQIDWIGLKNQLENWFKAQSGELMNHAVGAAGSVVSIIFTSIISLTFAIYILAQKETLKKQVVRLIHVWLPQRFGDIVLHVASVCNNTFRLYIAGQTTEAIILGTLCMLGMMILRLPYAPMIGALIAVTALIPIVGAFIGTIIGAIMILTVDPFKAFVFVIFLLILQQIEGNVIYPKVVGNKINLPAIWVLAAVTIGGNLAGPIGMLLGVPAASAGYALLKEATDFYESKQGAKSAPPETVETRNESRSS